MEETIKVSVMGTGEIEIKKGTTYELLSKNYKHLLRSDVMLAKIGNELAELTSIIPHDGQISFYDVTDADGMRVYTRGVSFVMIKAVKDVLGMDTDVVIEHSIKQNFYCEIRKSGLEITKELLEKIEERMKELVKLDLPIEKVTMKRRRAIELVKEFGMEDKAKLFKYRRASNVNLYRIGKFYDYFYGYMPPSTGYLKLFHLEKYEEGFLMQFPSKENPQIISEYTHLEKISSVFIEQLRWCQLMKVNNVGELNQSIEDGKFWDLVRVNEALHEKKIAEIADMICDKINDIKVVLIAGPSSSGKTTFAQRLCVQLKVNGVSPHAISLDNYFVNRDQTPKDEFGKHDFENINALDVNQFNEDIANMIQGKKVLVPSYNFFTGQREYKGNYSELKEGEIFVIEGIHGLNDILTHSIAPENKFKIFISAMTGLNVDDHNRISTSDSRLIRRIVRDNQFRGNSASDTIDIWPYVVRGEANNIFPFQENADVVFNSATIYELSILKQYIEPLLFRIDSSQPEFATAKRLIKFMDYFLGMGTEFMPQNSIMREFVGGSCFHV